VVSAAGAGGASADGVQAGAAGAAADEVQAGVVAAGASVVLGAGVDVAAAGEPCFQSPQDQPEEPSVTVAVTTSTSVV